MKNLLLLLLAILFLIGCEKESVTDVLPEPDVHDKGFTTLRIPSTKIDVCHYDADNNTWHVINIDENAWLAHAGHGDVRLDDQDDDGYVLDNECDFGTPGDCDDNNVAVNPGVIEICDNNIDDDCDGDVDGADSDCSTGCVADELEVQVDPDGYPETGDEYTLYVYPSDNSTNIPWSNGYGFTGANDLWDGDANTNAIVLNQGASTNYAAGLCASLKIDGCDWYLPSRDELYAMFRQLGPPGPINSGGSGDMPNGSYWSSTEYNHLTAWIQIFHSGRSRSTKGNHLRCRCVRR